MSSSKYQLLEGARWPVKAWVEGVPLENEARLQLLNAASLPFIHRWIAAMPDVHFGKGATVGSVIPTVAAIIPAAVGVDIGCGMMAVQTSLTADDLPGNLTALRSAIEAAVPHGRTRGGRSGDAGAWSRIPGSVAAAWKPLETRLERIFQKHPRLRKSNHVVHLGTLGGGNHFIEVCLDEASRVWVMLHSGSRGIGNRIGTTFIELARREMEVQGIGLPDRDLAYLQEGSASFDDYLEAVEWAQDYALVNRQLMMRRCLQALKKTKGVPGFQAEVQVVSCHHNYVAREVHYGQEVYLTRKGAVRAREGDLGIIPGSMGARSYIVRGKGNPESFCSCSHGAGRAMSRGEAKRRFTLAMHREATEGIECRKDAEVIDETPGAYKDIDAVMAAQSDLVEVVHTLRQVLCVKG